MFKHCLLACASLACALPNVSHAHHGLDFILVETPHLPARGAGYAFARVNRLVEADSETEIEPAVLYGLTDKVALEMHAHVAKEGSESLRYESVAPAVHVLLTPQGQRFSFGVSAEYAFAHDAEGDDVADVAAVFGYEHNRWMAGANLLYEKASNASGEFGYAAGVRRTFRGKHGVGFEVLGSFENDGYSEMMVGYYGELSPRFTFNAGVGTKLDEGPDHTAHMTFIWQFK